MTHRLNDEISYITGEAYWLYGKDEENLQKKLEISPDTPEYFTWLTGLSSFHFKGKGGYFTARRELKPGDEAQGGYWYAYRKAGKRQYKRYLGTTERLTLHRLETIAASIQMDIDHQPALEKQPRKKQDPKESKSLLRARITHLEKIVTEQDKHIIKLEQELRRYKIATPPPTEEYPLKIWALQLSVEQCLEYLKQTPGCHARERTYVDESTPDALLMIWYKDEKYAPGTINELRFITQQIHIDGLRETSKEW